nr:universal stress protein [Geodermatophilus obscurus]
MSLACTAPPRRVPVRDARRRVGGPPGSADARRRGPPALLAGRGTTVPAERDARPGTVPGGRAVVAATPRRPRRAGPRRAHGRRRRRGSPSAGRVVVGVDGSPGSRDALRYALTAATRRGAVLEPVSSYAAELYWMTGAPVAFRGLAEIREDTEKRIRDLLHEVAGQLGVPVDRGAGSVPTRLVAAADPAAVELTQRSEDADLLVVGSRGRGAVRSALLGSVALHCAMHARCPAMVVHPAGSRRTSLEAATA